MASILDLSGRSSDSENDGDYIPPTTVDTEESSEDENFVKETLLPTSKKKVKLDEDKKDESSTIAIGEKSREDVWKNFFKDVESTSPYKNSNKTPNEPKIIKEKLKEDTSFSNKDRKVFCTNITTESKSDSEPFNKSIEAPPKTLSCDKLTDDNIVSSNSLNFINHSNCDTKKQVDELINQGKKHVKGLSSVLGAISGKDKKVSVFEKSKHDWLKFKQSENIAEELRTFNKGKQGFIERQQFLQRSDVRLFETEKSARLGVKRK